MLRTSAVAEIREEYAAAREAQRTVADDVISAEFPNAAVLWKKRYQMIHPELGVAHACNTAFACLMRFCSRYKDYRMAFGATSRAPTLSATLAGAVDRVNFAPCPPEERGAYERVRAAAAQEDPHVAQIRAFANDFKLWISGKVGEKGQTVHLEPFQKNLLIHVLFFIAVTKVPALANQITEYLLRTFDLDFISRQSIDLFKQKATVFLVPRRHGKTWFTIPIICFLLKNIKDISIGYVAHQKHVSQFVMKEVEFKCRRMFGDRLVVENRDNVVSVDHSCSKSTALFASCYNTNSIRGQNFNLLLVDEAHFIKRDAFSTILGFLAQNTTKIIFISSTNTTSDATCFLTKLHNSPFDMLNVISYVCEEHVNAFSEKSDATACPCYRLHKPTFITINSQVRKTANMFLAGSFVDEIVGGTNRISEDAVLITDESREEFDMLRYSTMNENAHRFLGTVLYVYIDPAFTSNRKASGTGIAAVGTYRDQVVIYGLEHYFLKDLLDSSETAIAECAAHMLLSITKLHRYVKEIRVTIEGNLNQAAAVRIACIISQTVMSGRNVGVTFYHTPDQNGIEQPFYILGKEKRAAVETFIAKFNSGYIKASQELVSHTIKLSYDPVDYLLEQMKNIRRVATHDHVTYNAKKYNYSDDLLIATVMAVHMALHQAHARYRIV